MKLQAALSITTAFTLTAITSSFTITPVPSIHTAASSSTTLFHAPPSSTQDSATATGFIATELRGAAMKLHTRSQAPKEGKAEEKKKREPYVTTQEDYLRFLVDSQHVYKTFEEIVVLEDLQPELAPLINTGLERNERLETDIQFMVDEFDLSRPEVGERGLSYAKEIKDNMTQNGKEGIPEFMCHYYNYYFAHTAGGRMIGKQMASLLLEKKTLEFYKWDGDLNKIKETVKGSIEDMAASWSREEKDLCVDATASAFRGGGGLNAYLSGGQGHH
jgi:heme oxygenase